MKITKVNKYKKKKQMKNNLTSNLRSEHKEKRVVLTLILFVS